MTLIGGTCMLSLRTSNGQKPHNTGVREETETPKQEAKVQKERGPGGRGVG